MSNYAGNAKANTGVALASTALGLAALNPGGILSGGLGGIIGGGPAVPMMQKEILDLKTENTLLKANQFTLEQIQPMQITIAQQGEQIACLSKQMELNNQIIDGKIGAVACTANNGITALQIQMTNLQNTVNQIIQPFVPNTKVVTPPEPATAGA